MSEVDYTPLEKNLGYHFNNKALLQKALTHRSYRYENSELEIDNQRLEFLGDALLGSVCAQYLFHRFPKMQEGDLTRLRSSITNSETLAFLAQQLNISAYLLLGRGERLSGGATRDSNLTDCMESIIGAIFLDSDLSAIHSLFNKLFVPELNAVIGDTSRLNPKGCLQELTQKRWKTSPQYELVAEDGPEHERTFTYRVLIFAREFGHGCATNKRKAQSCAADMALDRMALLPEDISVHDLTSIPLPNDSTSLRQSHPSQKIQASEKKSASAATGTAADGA
ncbi:MAG: ribonuclease III [Spartobacteria bacterium]|nr:ribonuclease III [Spartobacteria bacterium]